MRSEKSTVGSQVQEDPICFKVESNLVRNFTSERFALSGIFILEKGSTFSMGDKIFIFRNGYFEIVQIKSDASMSDMLGEDGTVIGKFKRYEV